MKLHIRYLSKITLNPLKSDSGDGLGLFMHRGGTEKEFILNPAHFLKAAIVMAKHARTSRSIFQGSRRLSKRVLSSDVVAKHRY